MKTVEDLEKENEILKLKLKIAELEKELEQSKETIKEELKDHLSLQQKISMSFKRKFGKI